MGRRIAAVIECAVCGAVLGGWLGIVLLRRPLADLDVSLLAGCLGGGALLFWLRQRYPGFRREAGPAMAGLIPGLLLGRHLDEFLPVVVASTLGLLWGVAAFLLVRWLARRLERAGWYAGYGGEPLVVLVGGMVTAAAGYLLAWAIDDETGAWGEVAYWGLPVLLGTAGSLLPGVVLSRNPFRPVLGSLLGLVSGALILWFGISVAPMLFLPGSGLLWAGTVIGIAMLITSLIPLIYPQSTVVTGIVMIGLAVLSFVGATGGLVLGGLLGILAGALVAAWEGGTTVTAHHQPALPAGAVPGSYGATVEWQGDEGGLPPSVGASGEQRSAGG
ncbi:MAG: hypothetical protein DIU69_00560 [Bacillota bacterium]|nr:MAG: hypothetical protein DIU69_00560 [Bacillota bacterium]